MSLRDIVLLTIREGCIGETVAAIEAQEALEHTTDPALCELLQTISQDETRHAELAFRFVQWALSAGDSELFAAVRDEFESLRSESDELRSETDERAPTLDVDAGQLLRHGVIPKELRRVIRARAVCDVILPCARNLYTRGVATRVSATADRVSC